MAQDTGSGVVPPTDSEITQYPHPFYSTYEAEAQSPTVLAELRMMRLSWAIRSKKGWQEKMKNPEILQRWRREAGEQQEGLYDDQKLSKSMINYVFGELKAHARLTDPETGIQYACDDFVFCSHRLIPEESFLNELKKGVAVLEDVPEDKKDWHPGSNNQVLDLVHPSLYCLVYNRTLIFDKTNSVFNVAEPPPGGNEVTSRQYAWIPSDFWVSPKGEVRLESPYINNLHKSNVALYSVIPKILGRFVPMFERVLGTFGSDLEQPLLRGTSGRLRDSSKLCLWEDEEPLDEEAELNNFADFPGTTYKERKANFFRSQEPTLPEAPKKYTGALEGAFRVANLRRRTLQVIVKMANIHLTPARPEYPGGNWHVEGMLNERIVSTGIYYYDSENVTDSQLEFRTAVREPEYHSSYDSFCMQILYGIDEDDPLIQERGVVTTTPGLSLAFPNIYQHRVSSFQLTDPTKPGHRNILAFFLVDPNHRITSTTDVAPQQMKWIHEFMYDNVSDYGVRGTRFAWIPVELRELIVSKMDGLMTWKEACEFREGLMKERSNFVEAYDKQTIETTFNMCEH